jgi:hypothetical protein
MLARNEIRDYFTLLGGWPSVEVTIRRRITGTYIEVEPSRNEDEPRRALIMTGRPRRAGDVRFVYGLLRLSKQN